MNTENATPRTCEVCKIAPATVTFWSLCRCQSCHDRIEAEEARELETKQAHADACTSRFIEAQPDFARPMLTAFVERFRPDDRPITEQMDEVLKHGMNTGWSGFIANWEMSELIEPYRVQAIAWGHWTAEQYGEGDWIKTTPRDTYKGKGEWIKTPRNTFPGADELDITNNAAAVSFLTGYYEQTDPEDCDAEEIRGSLDAEMCWYIMGCICAEVTALYEIETEEEGTE